MSQIHIALGSNLGDRKQTLLDAVQRLAVEPAFTSIKISTLYETAPVGGPQGQGRYLNMVLAVETTLKPHDVLAELNKIENEFGRVRAVQDGPRTLDLDLLLYDDQIISTPTLTVPHPRMHERSFVLVPLAEIAADVLHPVLHKTIGELRDTQPVAELNTVRLFTEATHVGSLNGLTALVTGSTSGIGAAIANLFQTEGARVLTHGRRLLGPNHLVADLRDAEQVTRLADESWAMAGNGLDILVCNAGADTLTGDAAKWPFERKLEELLAVDLKATMHLARDIGARMKARGRGVILTVGWDQAETGMEGDSGQLFGAVKGAIMCFTRSLALSLAPEVRVNCLAPGWIRTSWGETASPVWQERVRRETPLGVWGLPDDIAAAALWLASPGAKFMTGQTIRINGGAVR